MKAWEAAEEDGFRVDTHFFSCFMWKFFFSPGETLLPGSWESDLLQKLEKLIHLFYLAVITQVNDLIQSGGPTGKV